MKPAGHRFWQDDVSIARLSPAEVERIRGHRQMMDAPLLAFARRHRSRLVTFDRKLSGLLPSGIEVDRHLLVLEGR